MLHSHIHKTKHMSADPPAFICLIQTKRYIYVKNSYIKLLPLKWIFFVLKFQIWINASLKLTTFITGRGVNFVKCPWKNTTGTHKYKEKNFLRKTTPNSKFFCFIIQDLQFVDFWMQLWKNQSITESGLVLKLFIV